MTYQAGRTATLTVAWYGYPGGPAAAVTGVQIRIAPIGGGAALVGPTSSGVVAETTSLHSYQWAVPSGQQAGDYLTVWTAVDGDGDTITASEVITVSSAPVPGGYASVDELTEKLGRTPVNAAQLIVRASRDVDRALLCAVYDAEDQAVVDALREATLEQVAANLDTGDLTGNGVTRPANFTIGKLSVTTTSMASRATDGPVKIGSLWEQAWDVLQQAGLTGFGPQSR